MSAKKFKFVSPGVFLNEIDNTQLPKTSDAVGPVIIGRARKGPALRPVRIESFSEFIEIFGDPIAGGSGEDVWREGNGLLAPTYGAYAAQAYLRNSSPINYVRLLGTQENEATVSEGEAGWSAGTAVALLVGQASGSAYYDVKMETGQDHAIAAAEANADVGAIFYTAPGNTSLKFQLKGQMVYGPRAVVDTGTTTAITSSTHTAIRGLATTGSWASGNTPEWVAEIYDGTTLQERISFNFQKTSPRFLRKVFNTNPAMTNSSVASGANLKKYWLGESFENYINNTTFGTTVASTYPFAATVTLGDTSFDGEDFRQELRPAHTNWFISQRLQADLNQATATFTFDQNATIGNVLTVISNHPDGTTKYFKAASSTSTVPNGNTSGTALEFKHGGSSSGAEVIAALRTCMVSANGFGSASVYFTISAVDGTTITLTQTAAGLSGNTAITSNVVNLSINGAAEATSTTFNGGGGFDASKMPKLFRLIANDSGEHTQRAFKISVKDIKAPRTDGVNPYGTFTVLVRSADDSDLAPLIVEQFSNCNLNPNSQNYIARKIGDMYQEWDSTQRRYKTYGSHPNLSKYFRVEMDTDVDLGAADPELVPFGVLGIPVYKDTTLLETTSGTHGWLGERTLGAPTAASDTGRGLVQGFLNTINVKFPKIALRVSASDGSISNQKDAYFGAWTHRSTSSIRHDDSYADHVAMFPVDLSGEILTPSSVTQHSWVFTLDDIIQTGETYNTFHYSSGSRERGTSKTAVSASLGATDDGYRSILGAGIDKFTAPVYGGFDGVDVTEAEAFSNRAMRTKTERTSYAYASVRRALESTSDPEVIECNLMAMPGITVDGLTKQMLSNCEARADALAVIDIDQVYTSQYETLAATFKARLGSGATSVAETFELRGLNSSYGCTYYPWVKIFDEINNASVWVPPSVIALGVMANTENRDALWFAPAGFNRGGLTEGSAGIPVLGVTEKLTSKERDTLYDANINPIASFPSEGIVVFGQKTLQVTPSALDRINVRRLLIFVKKRVSRIAARLLFDQNVQTTWERFVQQVSPFLESVKIGFGLSAFKIVLDATTTTPEMVDRNIMYAKIFLKPARAVEFIAVDFIITNTGAAFED